VNNCGQTEQTMFATILSQSGKVVTSSLSCLSFSHLTTPVPNCCKQSVLCVATVISCSACNYQHFLSCFKGP